MVIYHFPVRPEIGWQNVMMPAGAQPIHIGANRNGYRLWAIVDPTAEAVPTTLAVIGTGWEVPPDARHVHTDIVRGMVWHLFVPVQ